MSRYAVKITEIFHSIQGEGTTVGFPAVFIRVAGCSLKCDYCDTDFARSITMSVDDIVSEAKSYNCRRIVITGGEPFQLPHNIISAIAKRFNSSYTLEIETNAMRVPSDKYLAEKIGMWTLSPKLSSAKTRYEQSSIINRAVAFVGWLRKFGCRFQIKFVIKDEQDIDDALVILCALCLSKHELLVFQPCDNDPTVIDKLLADKRFFKVDSPWRLIPQTHKFLNLA